MSQSAPDPSQQKSLLELTQSTQETTTPPSGGSPVEKPASDPDSNGASATLAAEPAGANPADKSRPLVSTLPSDDAEFREIIKEFVVFLHNCLGSLRKSLAASDLESLRVAAHTLKGTAGSAGFDAFTAPARELQQLAAEGRREAIPAMLAALEGLASRISIPNSSWSETSFRYGA